MVNNLIEIQKYYDDGNSIRKCSEKFGISFCKLRRNLKVRKQSDAFSIQNKKRKRVENVISWRKRTKKKLIDYKGGKCCRCGYNKCIEAFDFHHTDPSKKDFALSSKSFSFERLKNEVDKCELVCSNCHREIHYNLKNNTAC